LSYRKEGAGVTGIEIQERKRRGDGFGLGSERDYGVIDGSGLCGGCILLSVA
jgi:hypothetical protein